MIATKSLEYWPYKGRSAQHRDKMSRVLTAQTAIGPSLWWLCVGKLTAHKLTRADDRPITMTIDPSPRQNVPKIAPTKDDRPIIVTLCRKSDRTQAHKDGRSVGGRVGGWKMSLGRAKTALHPPAARGKGVRCMRVLSCAHLSPPRAPRAINLNTSKEEGEDAWVGRRQQTGHKKTHRQENNKKINVIQLHSTQLNSTKYLKTRPGIRTYHPIKRVETTKK